MGFFGLRIESGNLERDDILLLDNAAVHWGQETRGIFTELMLLAGVRVLFQPKYSPEWNPCELVFAELKNKLKRFKDNWSPFWLEIIKVLLGVSMENVFSYYLHCFNVENKTF